MTTAGEALSLRPSWSARQQVRSGLGLLVLLLGMTGALLLIGQHSPSMTKIVVAGFALVGLLAMAIARYDYTVALAFGLSGVVLGVPTPSDLILFVVILLATATGRLVLRMPLAALLALGIFLATNIISAAAATDLTRARQWLVIVFSLAIVAVWLTGYIDSERRARIVVGGYLFAAVASAILGLAALLFPIPLRDTFLYGASNTTTFAGTVGDVAGIRAKALFSDPNVFGPFMMPILLIMLEDTLKPRLFRFRRLWKAPILCLLFAALVFSASRGAWLSLAVALPIFVAVLAVRRRGSQRVLPIMIGFVGAAVLVGGLITLVGDGGVLSSRTSIQGYDSIRFNAHDQGIQFGWDHPLGIGPGQFETDAIYNGQPVAAHSLYIRAFAEEGILGLVSLVALLLATLLYALRTAIRAEVVFGIGSAALLAAWCGILVHSYYVDSIQWRHAWLVMALIWIGAVQRRRRATNPDPSLEAPSALPARA